MREKPLSLTNLAACLAEIRIRNAEYYHYSVNEEDRAALLAVVDAQAVQLTELKHELADQEAEKLALAKNVLFFRASLAAAETALSRAAVDA